MKSSALEMAAESALVMDSNALQYDLAHLVHTVLTVNCYD